MYTIGTSETVLIREVSLKRGSTVYTSTYTHTHVRVTLQSAGRGEGVVDVGR